LIEDPHTQASNVRAGDAKEHPIGTHERLSNREGSMVGSPEFDGFHAAGIAESEEDGGGPKLARWDAIERWIKIVSPG